LSGVLDMDAWDNEAARARMRRRTDNAQVATQ
jgi:hypothetical protein